MDRTTNELMEIQKTIDEGDPYLIEVMVKKTESELLDELERLYGEFQRINENNEGSRRRHIKIIKTVEALYQAKMINRDNTFGGGVIIG